MEYFLSEVVQWIQIASPVVVPKAFIDKSYGSRHQAQTPYVLPALPQLCLGNIDTLLPYDYWPSCCETLRTVTFQYLK